MIQNLSVWIFYANILLHILNNTAATKALATIVSRETYLWHIEPESKSGHGVL